MFFTRTLPFFGAFLKMLFANHAARRANEPAAAVSVQTAALASNALADASDQNEAGINALVTRVVNRQDDVEATLSKLHDAGLYQVHDLAHLSESEWDGLDLKLSVKKQLQMNVRPDCNQGLKELVQKILLPEDVDLTIEKLRLASIYSISDLVILNESFDWRDLGLSVGVRKRLQIAVGYRHRNGGTLETLIEIFSLAKVATMMKQKKVKKNYQQQFDPMGSPATISSS